MLLQDLLLVEPANMAYAKDCRDQQHGNNRSRSSIPGQMQHGAYNFFSQDNAGNKCSMHHVRLALYFRILGVDKPLITSFNMPCQNRREQQVFLDYSHANA